MATAQEIIEDALANIGAIDPLESLTASEASHGLRKLNELLASWSNESLAVYAILQENFATVAGTAAYTIGSGATWNTTRPLRIEGAFIRESGNDYPIDVLNREEYDAVPVKTTQYRPEYLYYDPTLANGTVTLYGVPDKVYTVFLNSYKQLQSFAALTHRGRVAARIFEGHQVELVPRVRPRLQQDALGAAREHRAGGEGRDQADE